MGSKVEFNEEKFRELILYIAKQCENDAYFGATKLNKQLFFSDFLAYAQLGNPITGADYMALERGPAPRKLLPIRAAMEEDGEIYREIRGQQDRIVALRDPDLSEFSEDELRLVNTVVETLRNAWADEVSELSHHFAGWIAAIAEGQVTGERVSIPYETVFVRKPTLTEQERQQALAMAVEYEWPV